MPSRKKRSSFVLSKKRQKRKLLLLKLSWMYVRISTNFKWRPENLDLTDMKANIPTPQSALATARVISDGPFDLYCY